MLLDISIGSWADDLQRCGGGGGGGSGDDSGDIREFGVVTGKLVKYLRPPSLLPFISLTHSHSHSHTLAVSLSLSLSLSHSRCLSLSLTLAVSLSLSLTPLSCFSTSLPLPLLATYRECRDQTLKICCSGRFVGSC